MKAAQHSVEIQQQLRYFTLGNLNAQTRAIWIVCHGYGQLAPYFIRHFQLLAEAGHYIIAPEGLSRFYLQGSSGRVGASWMTKEERQTDIDNYVNYITAVRETAVKEHPAPLNLLGFSQGASTVSRWAMLSGQPFSRLVLWAGVYPPDLPLSLTANILRNKELYLVYGKQDPYISAGQLNEQLLFFKNLHIAVKQLPFDGKHEIKQEVLKNFLPE